MSPQRDGSSASTAWFVSAAALCLYLLSEQHAFWSDGRSLMFRVESGAWRYHVLAYLPVAQLARFAFWPLFGGDVERSLLLLSALCSAAGAGLVTRSARALGAGRFAAAAGGLLTALAPTVFFYATCVEVHSLQVLAAGIVVHGVVRSSREPDSVPNAVVLTLFFAALVVTHPTGLLWAPAFALYAFTGSGRVRAPRRMIPALIGVLGAAAVGWWRLSGGPSTERGLFRAALNSIVAWDVGFLASEFLVHAAILLALALVWILGSLLRTRRGPARRHRILVGIALALPFLVFLPGHGVAERGAYYISLYPVLGVLAALALAHLGRLALPLVLVLVPLQAAAARRFVWEWEHDYPGRPWAEAFVTEAGDKGFLFALEAWEREAIWKHSHMNATALRLRQRGQVNETPITPKVLKEMCRFFDAALAKGGRVAVTRSVIEYGVENADLARLLEALAERYGEPQPTLREEYLVYPAETPPGS